MWLLLMMMVGEKNLFYIPRCVICSAMMMRWEKQVLIYLLSGNAFRVNDTREILREIKLWKLQLNFNHHLQYTAIPRVFALSFFLSTILLYFSDAFSGIEFQNTQFSSFSLQRAIIVIITCMLYMFFASNHLNCRRWKSFFFKSIR